MPPYVWLLWGAAQDAKAGHQRGQRGLRHALTPPSLVLWFHTHTPRPALLHCPGFLLSSPSNCPNTLALTVYSPPFGGENHSGSPRRLEFSHMNLNATVYKYNLFLVKQQNKTASLEVVLFLNAKFLQLHKLKKQIRLEQRPSSCIKWLQTEEW